MSDRREQDAGRGAGEMEGAGSEDLIERMESLGRERDRLEELCRRAQRDLTELRREQERLRRIEEMYHALFSNSALAVGIRALDGAYVGFNAAYCRMLGYTEDELRWMRQSDLTHPDDRAITAQAMREIAEGRAERHRYQKRYIHKSGRVIWADVSIQPLREPDGTVRGVIGAVIDITERKQAEEQRERAAALLDAAIRQSPSGIVVADAPDVRIRIANAEAKGMRGLAPGPLIDIPVEEHSERWQIYRVDGTLYPPSELPLSRAVQKGETVRDAQFVMRSSEGEDRWVLANAAPIRDRDGTIVAGVVVFHDVTERRRAEEARARLEEQLQQARKLESVGQLAGGVAHDLNNMLTPILGYAETLLADVPPDSAQHEDLLQIQRAAARARDLVRQLLAFARKQTLRITPVELTSVLTSFQRVLRQTLREDVDVRMELPSVPLIIQGDSGQIEQIVLNLAVNAQEAMSGGGTLRISLGTEVVDETRARELPDLTPGPCVVLTISDTGSGMDRETLERIFDPFFTTKAQGQGTGLGLATVYGIVKQHGGAVTVKSAPGAGTTFRIFFPQSPGPSRKGAPTGEAQAARGAETVLVVEDQEQVRRLVCRILSRDGYHVLAAEGGEDALELAATHQGPIDLLITDVMMSGMNGRELGERMAEARPGLRVLYMSGYTADLIGDQGLSPAAPLIQKPFTTAALTAKVREVLDRSHDP